MLFSLKESPKALCSLIFRYQTNKSGWWLGTFFIFPYIGNNHPNWLIFFRGVQTTNQKWGYEFEDDGYPEDVDFNPALEFVCGRGDVVPQIDRGVEGLKIGDQRFIQCDEKNPLFGFPVLK